MAKLRGKEDYELGDLSIVIDNMVKEEVCTLTGKDEHIPNPNPSPKPSPGPGPNPNSNPNPNPNPHNNLNPNPGPNLNPNQAGKFIAAWGEPMAVAPSDP